MDLAVDGSESISGYQEHPREVQYENIHLVGKESIHKNYLVELNSNAAGCVWCQIHPIFFGHREKTKHHQKIQREVIFINLLRIVDSYPCSSLLRDLVEHVVGLQLMIDGVNILFSAKVDLCSLAGVNICPYSPLFLG